MKKNDIPPLDAIVVLADDGDNKARSELAAQHYFKAKQKGKSIPIYAAGTWSGANPEEIGAEPAKAFVIQQNLLRAGVSDKDIHLALDYGARGGDTAADLLYSAAAIDRAFPKTTRPLIGITTDKWHARVVERLLPYTWTPRLQPYILKTNTDISLPKRVLRRIATYAVRRMFRQAGVPKNNVHTTEIAFRALETHHPMFAQKPPNTLYKKLVELSLHDKRIYKEGYPTRRK